MRLVIALILIAAAIAPAAAQPGRSRKPAPVRPGEPPPGWKPPTIEMPGMALDGRLRTAQLLYFLERADEELERAALERRSFIPELVRTVDEGTL